MNNTIPLVDYLVLGAQPHLIARECTGCKARYLDRRNGCAACCGDSFHMVPIPTKGVLRSFTIVWHAAPGVAVPFVAGIVDCAGTWVRANILNVGSDPERVRLGMQVRLTTFSVGLDKDRIEAIGFGFEPTQSGAEDVE
ncbi:Zn-ribbon domain-containing OB-fold protein [Nocardia sp. SC052]